MATGQDGEQGMPSGGEAYFRTLLECVREIVLAADEQGIIEYASPSLEAVLGYVPLEATGKSVFSFVHPQDIPLVRERFGLVLTRPAGYPSALLDLRVRHRDGSYRWFEGTARKVDRGAEGFLLVFTSYDITDRKKTEEALFTSRIQLSEAVDLADIVYWEYDGSTDTFLFNDPFYEFLGTSAVGEGGYVMPAETYIERFIHPDDIGHLGLSREKMYTVAASEELPDLEHRIVRKDGVIRHIVSRRRVIRDEAGLVVRSWGVNQDITERVHTEERMAESGQFLQAILDASPIGICRMREDRTIEWFNAAFSLISGYTPSELEGRTTRILYPTDEEYERTGKVVYGGGQAEHTLVRKDGTVRHVFVQSASIDSRSAVVSVTDITGLRETESALRLIKFALDHAADEIIWGTPDGRILYANDMVCRATGFTFDELTQGKTVFDLGYSLSRARWEEEWRALGERTAIVIESERAIGANRTMPVEIRINRVEYEGNEYHCTFVHDIARRKEAEAALRQSEEKYRSIFDDAVLGIFQTTPNGRFVAVNRALALMAGYGSPEEMITTVVDISNQLYADPKDRGEIEKALLTQGIARASGVRLRRKDGSTFWVQVNIRIVLDKEGNTVRYEGTLEDVTDRIIAEQALQRSEATLKSVFSAAPVGMVIADPGRVPEWMNDAMISISGFPAEEQKEGGARLFYASEEEYERVGRVITEGIRSSGIGITDTKWVRKDGQVRDVHLRGAAIDPGDLSSGLVFVAVDITDQKKAERQLLESEAKYRLVVENSLVGVLVIQDNLIRFANRRWCDMYGYDQAEVIDRLDPLDTVHPDDKDMVRRNIGKRATGQLDSVEYEFRAFRRDGQEITVKVFGGKMIYGGRPAAVGTIIDVTREKTLESQLLQSQKMEAVGMLAGGVAHDFNNILTTLTGYGTLLHMKMAKEDPLQTYVDNILSASRKGAALTQSLLAFSRQEPLSLNPVNMNDILKGTAKLLKRLLTEDITLTTILCDTDIIVMADTTGIDQILFNLATNARDAMPDGGTLTIETRLLDVAVDSCAAHGVGKPGRYAALSVADTGVGMNEKTRERVFEPFFTTKGVGKGTGLGLPTVYGIVTQHQGFITLSSAPRMGTTVRIYIPAAGESARRETSAAEEIKRGKETILVAEDNEDVRRLIREILVKYGYTVIEAADGEEAIRRFEINERIIDLLILDSVMPGKNGRAVYDEISRKHPDIKVFFMSGYTRDIILDKGIEDKTFAFLSKPVAPVELLKKVRQVLDG